MVPSHCNPSAWLPPFLASVRFFPCPLIEDGQSCSPLPISGCLIFPMCFSFSLLFQLWRFWSLPSWTLCSCRWTPTKSTSFWSRFTVSFCSSALGTKCDSLGSSNTILFNILFLSHLLWPQNSFGVYICFQELVPTDLFHRSPNSSTFQGWCVRRLSGLLRMSI